MQIDRTKVIHPTLELTKAAQEQLNLIIENDYTLTGKDIRLSITGKECDGFVYSLAFDNFHSDDFKVKVNQLKRVFLLDPMCAYYLNSSFIDFIQDHTQDEEGFVITNKNQNDFYKKFWLKDSTKLPSLVQGENTNGL